MLSFYRWQTLGRWDAEWEKEGWNVYSLTWRHCLCHSVSVCDRDCLNISNLKQRRPTLLGNTERGGFNWALHAYANLTCFGYRVLSTKHVNHFPVKKGRDIRLKPISHGPKYCTHGLPFHSLWESRFQKSYINFFFQSRGSDSSYISHWIDLCFQQSSPLLVCWLVERWQIGFHSLHGGAQWSGFDRVKRNSASMPPPLFLYAHFSLPASLLFFFLFLSLSLPWGLENGWPCLTWTTLMSSPLHYCTYSTPACSPAALFILSLFFSLTHTREQGHPSLSPSADRQRSAELRH